MKKIGIVGASGYGGGELLRLLRGHPEFTVAYIASESDAGKAAVDVFPQLRGANQHTLQAYDLEKAVEAADLFFLPVANGRAMMLTPPLLSAGKKIVDFSADFRLRDRETYESTYKIQHTCPELLDEAVYGLVELNRSKIKSARLIANPGCYPTAAILALLPLVSSAAAGDREGLADPHSIIVDAYSGVTGAGRTSLTLDYHFPEVNDSLTAYKVVGHRHTREIEQAVAQVTGAPAAVTFTPHLAPIGRGILATAYATLRKDLSLADLRGVYETYYANSPFVVILPEGEMPRTGAVRGSNYVHLSVNLDPRVHRVTVLAAEDNLVKGAAGQAIQNMNLLCGLPEETGLGATGMYP